MSTLRRRLTKDEEGFTLIELMVVVLIIAILIAIAIPTFLGAQDRARDRGAQSNLRNALTAAKTIATDDAGKFTNVTVANLLLAEGALPFAAAGGADDNIVLVGGGATDDEVLFYTRSASDTWFAIATTDEGLVANCRAGDAAAPTAAVVASYAGCAAGTEW